MAALWLPTGVIKGYLNELQPYGDSSGRQVKVKTGKAWIAGVYYENDAEIILAVTANSSGSTRLDRIVVRVNWTTNTCALLVVAGTPGAGTAPAPTNTATTWDLNLGYVTVVNGAATIAAADVKDERGRLDLSGGYTEPRLAGAICVSTARPTTWPVGGRIHELDTGRSYTNTGTDSVPVWGHAGDTDLNTASPHHSLGVGSTQAAAGNHNHDTAYSTAAHSHGVTGSVVGTGGAQTLSNKTLDRLRLTNGSGYIIASTNQDLGNATTLAGEVVIVKAWGANVTVSATGSTGIVSRPTDPNGGVNATVTIANGDSYMFVASAGYWWLV
jgi:hypothetical protein